MEFHGACCKWLEHFNIKAKGILTNAVDIKEYDKYKNKFQENKQKIEILYAGRLIKDKGVLLLQQANKIIQSKYKNVSLLIAGQGPLYDELKKDTSLKLLGKLEYDKIMEYYAKADIFVNPSSFAEGLPTTVLEAGLMKCAVVATDAGGTIEVIEDNNTGLLCKPEVNSIVEKLEMLINDNKLSKNLAENLHKKVCEQFSWEKTVEEILEIIGQDSD